jgi:phage shock protein PspC (stress-responsive transcriptional regulator)
MSFSLIPRVYAACTPGVDGVNLGDCLTLKDGTTVAATYNKPAVLVDLIVRNAFILAGVIVFFLIIYAGFKFITDSTKGQEEAKTMMEAAGVGLILMFAAYWIIQIIKVVTGIDYLGF